MNRTESRAGLTNRQRYAMHCAMQYLTAHPNVVRLRPFWWTLDMAVAMVLRDYDKVQKEMREREAVQ